MWCDLAWVDCVRARPVLYASHARGLGSWMPACSTCANLPAAMPHTQPPLPTSRFALHSWADAKPSADIALPQRNDYLPTDFTLRCDQQAAQQAPTAAEQKADGGAAQPNGQQQAAADGAQQQQANGGAAESGVFPSPPSLLLDEPGG